jgi:hypothetical protein
MSRRGRSFRYDSICIFHLEPHSLGGYTFDLAILGLGTVRNCRAIPNLKESGRYILFGPFRIWDGERRAHVWFDDKGLVRVHAALVAALENEVAA